ncbi:MAG TPA: PLP-dependent aminotransferase family protein [Clostridiaceae bacterium]
MLEITPKLNSKDKDPLYIQLYKYLKGEILLGNIGALVKLPSIRGLSKTLGLSKNTIEAAYEQLIAEGYVKARSRSGLYVEAIQKDSITSVKLPGQYPLEIAEHIISKYDFTSGQIDLDLFPFKDFQKILSRTVDREAKELLSYGEHKGDYGLRVEIAKHLHYSRGVTSSPEQILISSGSQQSLSMLSHIILKLHKIISGVNANIDSGYKDIAFEEPGYVGAKEVFNHFGFKVLPINLEEDGLNLKLLKDTRAKLVYVTPSHQYPFGMVMPIGKRLELLQWAVDNCAYILEDDYDGEFRYRGKPVPSLQGLDTKERVIYLGSFSKSLMPSIRISYLILPKPLLNIYEESFKIYEQSVSRLMQKALEDFMKEGFWEKHLRKLRTSYKRKQEALLYYVNKYLGDRVIVIGADSGLHILLEVKTNLREEELIQRALGKGVVVKTIKSHYINPVFSPYPVIFIGFAGINLEDIPIGIKLLAESWF